MKKFLTLTAAALMLLYVPAFTGCQMTPVKMAVTTLADVGVTANAAYAGYLTAVLQKVAPTNDVPKVTGYFRDFHMVFALACNAAQYATNNTFADPAVTASLTKLVTSISTAEGK